MLDKGAPKLIQSILKGILKTWCMLKHLAYLVTQPQISFGFHFALKIAS